MIVSNMWLNNGAILDYSTFDRFPEVSTKLHFYFSLSAQGSVMTLRTPRRRISPRTKTRYRAIRQFFRRALGSTSQENIKINSSIAVNVTDIKRKIVSLEQQLNEVNKHCRDITSLSEFAKKEYESEVPFSNDLEDGYSTNRKPTQRSSISSPHGLETERSYEPETGIRTRTENSECTLKPCNDNNKTRYHIMVNDSYDHFNKSHDKELELQRFPNTNSKLDKYKTASINDSIDNTHLTRSLHSLANPRINIKPAYPHYSHNRKHIKKESIEEIFQSHNKDVRYKDFLKINDHNQVLYEEKPVRKRRNNHVSGQLDPDFISGIIQKQYKPVKMFVRKESNYSQLSAPVCRDKEFSVPEDLQEGFQVCSCYYCGRSGHKYSKPKQNDNDMQSVCDARLYSSNKHARHKHRRVFVDPCNNSDMYDYVPVKERSSPKTRRKFFEDSMNQYCREVPPTPKTHRPRLNLEAQYYTELGNYMAYTNPLRKRSPYRRKVYQHPDCIEISDTDWNSNLIAEKNLIRQQKSQGNTNFRTEEHHVQVQEQAKVTVGTSQCKQCVNEHTSTTDTITKTTPESDEHIDKTDKALCEIKDILQTFLQEIKKETLTSVQCVKSETSCKFQCTDSPSSQGANNKINNNTTTTNCQSINNFNPAVCGINPCLSPFTNPYCYPVMPICPVSCPLENGHPSKSFTCSNCASAPKATLNSNSCQKNADTDSSNKTEELIKEIYNFVAFGPYGKQEPERDNNEMRSDEKHEVSQFDDNILTTRSVGACNKNVHDANVGTSLKCYSRSCEAIGPKSVLNTSDVDLDNIGTSTSYSDTMIDRSPLAVSTRSETDVDTVSHPPNKSKGKGRLSRVLRSIGLFKKKRKDVIQHFSESENTETEAKPQIPLFKQEETNYKMHHPDCYRPPPNEAVYMCQDYQQRPNFSQPPRDHQSRNFEPRPQEYQRRPCDFPPPPHEHQTASPRYTRLNEYPPDCHPPYNPCGQENPSTNFDDYYRQSLHHSAMPDHQKVHFPHQNQRPMAPHCNCYDSSMSQMHPPLCLKEVEVKSSSTQSERKLTIFEKFKKKKKPVSHNSSLGSDHRNYTQTQPIKNVRLVLPQKAKPVFSWKGLQTKAMRENENKGLGSIQAYSLKTQNELTAGDQKLRNAMLKKFLNPKNPFSSRNMLIKTLLGKDAIKIRDPPAFMNVKMFD